MNQTLTPRILGDTGLSAAPLGLAGSFGVDAETVKAAFYELGVNYFFVTPRMTGLVAGIRTLIAEGQRDKLVIATGAKIPFGFSVTREWEKAARALGTDTLDVFHLFWVQAHWYVTGNTWPAMAHLKEQGKVRALAISCHDRKMARSLVDELALDALMIRYNAAHRGAEKEIFATLPEARPFVIAYTATRWGKLLSPAGKLGPMSGPECYRFQLSHPAVDVALCGARNMQELRANVAGVLEGPLPDSRMAEVKAFGDLVRSAKASELVFTTA